MSRFSEQHFTVVDFVFGIIDTGDIVDEDFELA